MKTVILIVALAFSATAQSSSYDEFKDLTTIKTPSTDVQLTAGSESVIHVGFVAETSFKGRVMKTEPRSFSLVLSVACPNVCPTVETLLAFLVNNKDRITFTRVRVVAASSDSSSNFDLRIVRVDITRSELEELANGAAVELYLGPFEGALSLNNKTALQKLVTATSLRTD